MTLVLNGKGLLLEGSDPKIEDKQVPGIYVYIYIHIIYIYISGFYNGYSPLCKNQRAYHPHQVKNDILGKKLTMSPPVRRRIHGFFFPVEFSFLQTGIPRLM